MKNYSQLPGKEYSAPACLVWRLGGTAPLCLSGGGSREDLGDLGSPSGGLDPED